MRSARPLLMLPLVLAAAAAAAAFLFSSSDPELVADRFGRASPDGVEESYRLIRDCLASEGSGVDSSCSDALARQQVARTNPATVVEAVRLGLERDTLLFESTCHNFMHVVGQVSAVYVRSFEELRAAAAQLTDVCQFGMYHGLVEGYADALPFQRLEEEFPQLCTAMQEVDLGGRATREYVNGECYHGIGHVAARRTEDRFEEGLSLCATIAYEADATSCATGVIMNWTDNAVRWELRSVEEGADAPQVPPQYRVVPYESRWEICELVGEFFRPPCLFWMGSAAVSSSDPQRIRESLSGYLSWCERFPDDASQVSCLRSVAVMAGDLPTMTALGGPAGSAALCRDLAPARLLVECVGQTASVALAFIPPAQVRLLCEPWAGTARYEELCAEVDGRLEAALGAAAGQVLPGA